MRYFVGFLLGIVCFHFSAQAGSPWQNSWTDGQITLNSGQLLKGKIRYDLENDIVVVMQAQGQMRAFGAHSVESFTLADTSKGVVQNYFTLPYAHDSELPQLKFFKLVFDGSFTLFAREKEVSKGATRLAKRPMRLHPEKENKALAQEYFVFFPDGSFKEFRGGHRNIADMLSLKENEVHLVNSYISQHNINLRRQTDIIRLIHHFVDQKNIASR